MDGSVDVVSDVLETLRFSTLLFGRFELGAPWALRLPKKASSSFYVLVRGSMRARVEGADQALLASAGDVVLVPAGSAHVLDDGARRAPAPRDFICVERLREPSASSRRLGGRGATCSLVSGCFRLSTEGHSPLLDALPPAIHLAAHDPDATGWLASTVRLIAAESTTPRPGSALVLGRLADVLLVQALRRYAADPGAGAPGLRALADPAIGRALGLVHTRLREPWTVQRLAAAVGMSRSGFAARFHALVGEPPLRYVAGWRMAKAAQWLRETSDGIPSIAERVGYDSAAAFHKAFKRWYGVGPGRYRRATGDEPGGRRSEEP